MKRILSAVLIVAVCVAVILWFFQKPDPRNDWETKLPPDVMANIRAQGKEPQTNVTTQPQGFSKRLSDMTEVEQATLKRDFNERYKPTVEKWFKAYEGRIPFELQDFTLDKFHSRFGDHLYTFMFGDTTFTIQDSTLGLKVSYLMTRQAAKQLNQVPGPGFVPNLDLAVTRDEIIRMVKSDSGIEFKPNEVLLKPTAAACALNGGVFVTILPTGADPNNIAEFKLYMVFGPDGKMVNYERDPFF